MPLFWTATYPEVTRGPVLKVTPAAHNSKQEKRERCQNKRKKLCSDIEDSHQKRHPQAPTDPWDNSITELRQDPEDRLHLEIDWMQTRKLPWHKENKSYATSKRERGGGGGGG